MKERRGDTCQIHRADDTLTKRTARIIRFNEGGTLFDFSNHYLGIDHLRMILLFAHVYTQQRKDFLYAVMRHASVTSHPLNESLYSLFRREYKMLRRKAKQLMNEIDNEQPRLF